MFKLLATLFLGVYANPHPLDKRLVSGYGEDIYNHPYLVQITAFKVVDDPGFHELYHRYAYRRNCAGAILNARWVLTAARCFDHCSSTKCNATLRGGSTLWGHGAPTFYSESIVIHDNYSAYKPYRYDLALVSGNIRLMEDKEYTDSIRLLKQQIPEGYLVTIPGWGSDTCDWWRSTYQLLAVDLPVMNKDQCKKVYARQTTKYELDETLFCLEGSEGRTAAAGDYGAPAVILGYLAGIVAFSIDCMYPNAPIIITNISFYTAWIESGIRVGMDKLSSLVDPPSCLF